MSAPTALQFHAELKAVIEANPVAPRRFVGAELRAWRLFGAEIMPHLERALAAQGETPDPRTLHLQHSLAELLRSSASPDPEQPNQT